MAPEATGRPSYHPAVLLKLYIYGYLNRVQSSRRLEREALHNIEVMWLTGRLVPDHKTIADFRRDNGGAIKQVCVRFIELCPKKIPTQFIYGMCFRLSLAFTLELVERSIGLEGNEISLIVEDGAKGAGFCPEIVSQIKKHVSELREIIGTCVLKEKCDLPGLQSADAVSYSGYRQEREGNEFELMDFDPNWDLDKAKQILKAKSPVFRSYGKPEIMRQLKDNLFILEEKRRLFGQQKTL